MQFDYSYLNIERSLRFDQIFVQHGGSGVEHIFFEHILMCENPKNFDTKKTAMTLTPLEVYWQTMHAVPK